MPKITLDEAATALAALPNPLRPLTLLLPEAQPVPLAPREVPPLDPDELADGSAQVVHDALRALGAVRRRHGVLKAAVEDAARAVSLRLGPEMGELERLEEELKGLLTDALAPVARAGAKAYKAHGAGEAHFRKGRPEVVCPDVEAAIEELERLGAYHLVRRPPTQLDKHALLKYGLPEEARTLRIEPAGISVTFHV